MFLKRIVFFALMVQVSLPSFANETDQQRFDLYGDGQLSVVKLPFKYYERQKNDNLTLIPQGGYKIYDIASSTNEIAVIGPLRPCIGIAVTDKVKLITFHKHCANSLESIGKILRENLNLSFKGDIYASIYTTKDDKEWNQHNRQEMHGGKTHLEEVKSIKDFLDTTIGIPRININAGLQNLRSKSGKLIYDDGYLGRYDLAEVCVAVQLRDLFESSKSNINLKLFSIDPFTEDVFGYKGKQISAEEYLGPKGIITYQKVNNLDKDTAKSMIKRLPLVSYDQIAGQPATTTRAKGYEIQRAICERRMEREEEALYSNFFGKNKLDLFTVNDSSEFKTIYNTLDFYPI